MKSTARGRTVEAEPGFQAQGVARAQAAQAVARVLQQLLRQLHGALVWHADLKAVLAGVPTKQRMRAFNTRRISGKELHDHIQLTLL